MSAVMSYIGAVCAEVGVILAGFGAQVMSYIVPWAALEPPEALQRKIFPWAEEQLEKVKKLNANKPFKDQMICNRNFLELMIYLRKVLWQGAASMQHAMFKTEPIFKTTDALAYFAEARTKAVEHKAEKEAVLAFGSQATYDASQQMALDLAQVQAAQAQMLQLFLRGSTSAAPRGLRAWMKTLMELCGARLSLSLRQGLAMLQAPPHARLQSQQGQCRLQQVGRQQLAGHQRLLTEGHSPVGRPCLSAAQGQQQRLVLLAGQLSHTGRQRVVGRPCLVGGRHTQAGHHLLPVGPVAHQEGAGHRCPLARQRRQQAGRLPALAGRQEAVEGKQRRHQAGRQQLPAGRQQAVEGKQWRHQAGRQQLPAGRQETVEGKQQRHQAGRQQLPAGHQQVHSQMLLRAPPHKRQRRSGKGRFKSGQDLTPQQLAAPAAPRLDTYLLAEAASSVVDVWRQFRYSGPNDKPPVVYLMRRYGGIDKFYHRGDKKASDNNRKNIWTRRNKPIVVEIVSRLQTGALEQAVLGDLEQQLQQLRQAQSTGRLLRVRAQSGRCRTTW